MKLSFYEAYKKYVKYAEVKQKFQSFECLKRNFNDRILPYWKDFNIYDITVEDYIEWQHLINKDNLKYSYKKKLHYIMSAFFNYCMLFLELENNIAKQCGCFNKTNDFKTTHDFYTYKEFKKFIKYVDNEIYKQFFIFMFFTGVRPGEAMALKFNDMLNNRVIINKTISEHYDPITKKRIIGTPKTISSNRIIMLDKKTYKGLNNLKKYYLKENGFNNNYFVFGGKKPLALTTIRRYKNNASINANLKNIRLHDFRHSHASLLFSKKIPIMEISKRLGHENISTTLNTYTHISNEQEKRVIKTLSNLRLFP